MLSVLHVNKPQKAKKTQKEVNTLSTIEVNWILDSPRSDWDHTVCAVVTSLSTAAALVLGEFLFLGNLREDSVTMLRGLRGLNSNN